MIVTIDFETFWTRDYSLTKLSEVDYILSPLFQPIMCAVKLGDGPTQVYVGDANIRAAFAVIDWDNVALLSHNMRFDGAIMCWRYGITPRLYLDTLSMARAMTHAYTGKSSLAVVAKHLGFPPKGSAVNAAQGLRLEDFGAAQLAEYAEYCAHDADLCRMIFDRLKREGFPNSEIRVIDLVIRMFVAPQASLNIAKLTQYLGAVQAEQYACFQRVAYLDKAIFSSNAKFAELLESFGVTVPKKVSPTTGAVVPALARNDWAFKELVADESQPAIVQVLLACRLNVKSTIAETRTKTLINLARYATLGMPVPYRYWGAHTGRLSGDGGFNFANLQRGSPIRDAIEAPLGMRIVHRDSSQIEARMVAWLAGCDSLTQAFAEGRDVYCEFATKFYGRKISRENERERFTGKTAVLSLGYNAGSKRFRHALYIGQGGVSVELTEDEAREIVDFYRTTYREIPQLWARMHDLLGVMALKPNTNLSYDTNVSPVLTLSHTRDTITLPSQMKLRYPRLRTVRDEEGRDQFVYDGPYANEATKKIYGGKLTENVVQALARIVVSDAMLWVHRETGKHPIMSTYDSLDYCVPEHEAEAFNALLERAFARVPTWCLGLPLASEGGWGRSLLEAEKGMDQ